MAQQQPPKTGATNKPPIPPVKDEFGQNVGPGPAQVTAEKVNIPNPEKKDPPAEPLDMGSLGAHIGKAIADGIAAQNPKEPEAPPLDMAAGKGRYNMFRGKWVAARKRGDFVLQWKFVPDANGPQRTGIPMKADEVEKFNAPRRIGLGNTAIDQLIEVGDERTIYHDVDDPLAIETLDV